MTDPLQAYSPAELYERSARFGPGWSLEQTVETYVSLHSDAAPEDVRAAIKLENPEAT